MQSSLTNYARWDKRLVKTVVAAAYSLQKDVQMGVSCDMNLEFSIWIWTHGGSFVLLVFFSSMLSSIHRTIRPIIGATV